MSKGFLAVFSKITFLLAASMLYFPQFTNSVFTSQDNVRDNTITAGFWETEPGQVVINEVYYDVSDDKGTENKNEWIELYNNSGSDVSLKKWYFVDAAGTVKIINPEVFIPAHGFAVLSHDNTTWTSYWTLPWGVPSINLTGSTAWLNNNGGETLALYDDLGEEKDFVAWEGGAGGWNLAALESQSIARKVKGVDTDLPSDWEVLANPNPGTNPHSITSTKDPQLSFILSDDKKSVSFTVFDIREFIKLSYELVYDTDSITQGIAGNADLDKQTYYVRDNLILGTCSSGGCTYHSGVHNIRLVVSLEDKNGGSTSLEQSIP